MIKQFKTAVAAAVVLTAAVAFPVYAADTAAAPKKPVSCTKEAKNSGLTDKKEIKAYVKECSHKRAEARKAAKKHKKHAKVAKKHKKHVKVAKKKPQEPMPKQAPAAEPAPQQGGG